MPLSFDREAGQQDVQMDDLEAADTPFKNVSTTPTIKSRSFLERCCIAVTSVIAFASHTVRLGYNSDKLAGDTLETLDRITWRITLE